MQLYELAHSCLLWREVYKNRRRFDRPENQTPDLRLRYVVLLNNKLILVKNPA